MVHSNDDNSLEIENFFKTYMTLDSKDGGRFFDFEKAVPITAKTEMCDIGGGRMAEIMPNALYNERLEKWGVKWNTTPDDCQIMDEDHYVDFMTAWSSPVPVIRALAEKHKNLQFELKYYEEGMGFRGEYFARHNAEGEFIESDDCWNMTEEDRVDLGLDEYDDDEAAIEAATDVEDAKDAIEAANIVNTIAPGGRKILPKELVI
jgi:hypothetical protein